MFRSRVFRCFAPLLSGVESRIGDSTAVAQALDQYISLDQTAVDSYTAHNWRGSDVPSGTSFLLRALQTHQQDPSIVEKCARGLANVALLAQEGETSPLKTLDPLTEIQNSGVAVPALTKVAVNRPQDFSPRGMVWVSTALMNILLLDDEAARGNAQELLKFSTFLDECLNRFDTSQGFDKTLAVMAVDNSLALIGRVLSMQLPGDDAEVSFAYDIVDYSLIEGVLRAMVKCGGGGGTSSAEERNLEVLHKGWECLRLLSLSNKNIRLLTKALGAIEGSTWDKALVVGKEHGTGGVHYLGPKIQLSIVETLKRITDGHDVNDNTAHSELLALGGNVVSDLVVKELVGMTKSGFAGMEEEDRRVVLEYLGLLANLAPWNDYIYTSSCVAVVVEFVKMMAKVGAAILGPELSDATTMKIALYFWNVTNRPEGVAACKEFKVDLMVRQFVERNPDVELIKKLDEKFQALMVDPKYVGKGKDE